MTMAPSSVASCLARPPPSLPNGVRSALTITDLDTAATLATSMRVEPFTSRSPERNPPVAGAGPTIARGQDTDQGDEMTRRRIGGALLALAITGGALLAGIAGHAEA